MMRNLPQTIETFQTNDQFSEDSNYNTVCPSEWPMNDKKPCPSFKGTRRSFAEKFNPTENKAKLNQFCNYLAEHRSRLLLTFISLIFLSIFLVVIYRQFGWITFASVLGIVAVPFIFIFIYAKRLQYKEQKRSHKMDRSFGNLKHQMAHTSSVFSTNLEMENLNAIDSKKERISSKIPKQTRKSHKNNQKITIKLSPIIVKKVPLN